MLYVAVPVQHPAIAFVRVALPLTDVRQQLQPVLTATLTALGVALRRRGRHRLDLLGAHRPRVRLIAGVAERYRRGDLTPPQLGFGDDELGTVARALDDSVQEVGRRLGEQARDRARMEAILAGMVEGVIVVDPQGRLQLVNDAARQMLKLDDAGDRTAVRRDDPAAGDRRARGRRAARAGRRRRCSCRRRAIRRARSWRSAAPAAGAVAHGVDPRAARHHRAAAGRSDPPRLRRQRLARAAHAADRDSRLRRSAVRRRHRRRTSGAGSSTIIARHTQRMERLVKDLLRLARLDAGQETLDLIACDTRSLAETVVADVAPARRGARPAHRGRHRAGRRNGPRRSGEAARRAAQPGGQRDHLRAGAVDDPHRRRRATAAASRSRCPTRARAFRRRICRGCSNASTASTSRARAIPAAPASASRSSSTSSSCTAEPCAPRTGPERGARFHDYTRHEREHLERDTPRVAVLVTACTACTRAAASRRPRRWTLTPASRWRRRPGRPARSRS